MKIKKACICCNDVTQITVTVSDRGKGRRRGISCPVCQWDKLSYNDQQKYKHIRDDYKE